MDSFLLQIPAQLSLHLKSLRETRKLTQADMAMRLQVSQARYSQIERHPELVATGRLLDILAALGVDVVLKLRPPENPRDVDKRPTLPVPTRWGEDW